MAEVGVWSGSGGSMVSALGDLLTFGLSSAMNRSAQNASYKQQKKLLQMQMDWMEEMSNTAHQREVDDLRAAGLNPVLSAMGGSGASAPGVTAPSVQKADMPHYGSLSSSAKTMAKLVTGEVFSEIEKNSADADKASAEADEARVRADNAKVKGALELEQARQNIAHSAADTESIRKHGRNAVSTTYNIIGETSDNLRKVIQDSLDIIRGATSSSARARDVESKLVDLERDRSYKKGLEQWKKTHPNWEVEE